MAASSQGRRASIGTPSARHEARDRSATSSHRSKDRRREQRLQAFSQQTGERRSATVGQIATVTPPLRTMPPRYTDALAGSSTAFTKRRRAAAAAATSRFTSGGAAATTNHAS